MKLFLLDAGGAGLVIGVLIVFMFIAIIVEALTMIIMKYNKPGKAFLDSLVINLVSLIGGYCVIFFFDSLDISSNALLNFILLYLLTVLIEGITLYFLNRSKPVNKTILAAVVINLITYAGLFFLNTYYI